MHSNTTTTTESTIVKPVIQCKNLVFDYGVATHNKTVLNDVSFTLPRGSRMLLVGDVCFLLLKKMH